MEYPEKDSINFEKIQIIHQYTFLNNGYVGTIYQKYSDKDYYYKVNENLQEINFNNMEIIRNLVKNQNFKIELSIFSELSKKIDFYNERIMSIVESHLSELSLESKRRISFFLTLEYLQLRKLYPLLVDPQIEEIFLDSMEDNIYLNYRNTGKVRTDIQLNENEIESLKTHIRLESKKRLDYEMPSIVHVVSNPTFNCRIAIDIFPHHWKDVSIDIRKLDKKLYSIIEMIEFQTLDIEIMRFLLFCLFFKINITIIGEVNTGKTTLLNLLDSWIPPTYRKIYVEETIETCEKLDPLIHQLKFLVEPELNSDDNKKGTEIYNLLHRSGDVIILGEILSKNETKAMFQCLSMGLSGLQTTHASSIQGVLNRWLIHYGIDKSCINDLGLIIQMKKIGNYRKILKISEITYEIIKNSIDIHNFFEYEPENNCWKKDFNVLDSNIIKNLRQFISISEKKFNSLLDSITKNLQNYINIRNSNTSFEKFDLFRQMEQILEGE